MIEMKKKTMAIEMVPKMEENFSTTKNLIKSLLHIFYLEISILKKGGI